jgi:predicted enzyme related to lactoylglutathione lyase
MFLNLFFRGINPMITAVTHVTLFVKDQDKALAFYKKLGFMVHTDAPMGDERWLTIATASQPHFEIALMKATEKETALVGKQGGEHPLLCVATDDCMKTYNELKQQGVQFLAEPKHEAWGTSVCFIDCEGNMIYLCQSAN